MRFCKATWPRIRQLGLSDWCPLSKRHFTATAEHLWSCRTMKSDVFVWIHVVLKLFDFWQRSFVWRRAQSFCFSGRPSRRTISNVILSPRQWEWYRINYLSTFASWRWWTSQWMWPTWPSTKQISVWCCYGHFQLNADNGWFSMFYGKIFNPMWTRPWDMRASCGHGMSWRANRLHQ